MYVSIRMQSSFTNWYKDHPQNNGEMNCVGMVSESGHVGQWKDLTCNAKHGFICEKTGRYSLKCTKEIRHGKHVRLNAEANRIIDQFLL